MSHKNGNENDSAFFTVVEKTQSFLFFEKERKA
jgi:hypothetical protein